MNEKISRVRWALLVLAWLVTACGGGGAAVTATSAEAGFARLDLSPSSAQLEVGATLQLDAVAVDASGAPISGLGAPTFSSSDPATAQVDGAGQVTAVGRGTAVIRADLTAWGASRSGTATVEVMAPGSGTGPSSLSLVPAQATIPVGGSVRLEAVPLDAAGTPLAGLPAPTFRSADPAVATVGPDGEVLGIAPGSTAITAELAAGAVVRSASSEITVIQPIPTSAVVSTPARTYSPGTVTIAAGGSVTWQIVERRHNVTFTGAAPPDGDVPDTREGNSVSRTFPEPGEYRYECTRHRDRGMRGTVVVVAAGPPRFTSLTLTPAAASVAVGATISLTATALDQNGQPLPGLPRPAFSSSDPGRATVDSEGRVRGVAAGAVTVTATLTHEGTTREARAAVTVGDGAGGPPASATVATPGVTFSPGTVTIGAGGTVTWSFTGTRHNVFFQGAAPPGGHIPDTEAGISVSRSFPTAGTYDYECTRHSGMTGRVIVQ